MQDINLYEEKCKDGTDCISFMQRICERCLTPERARDLAGKATVLCGGIEDHLPE
jgi:hypothetical protein